MAYGAVRTGAVSCPAKRIVAGSRRPETRQIDTNNIMTKGQERKIKQLTNQLNSKKAISKKKQPQQLQITRTPVPAALAVQVVPGKPNVAHSARGTRVKHAEVFSSVLASINFMTASWDLNPGQAALPWLRNIAGNYTKYKIHSWSARYVPVDTNSSKSGRVYMGFDYDSAHHVLSTKSDITNLEDNASGMGYKDLLVKMTPSLAQAGVQWKRIRQGPVAGAANLYDPAAFLFGTEGFDSNFELGEIWMSYDIEFIGSQTSWSEQLPRGLSVLRKTGTTSGFPDGAVGQAIFNTSFGGTQEFEFNDLGLTLTAGGVLTLRPGTYEVTTSVTFTVGNSDFRDARVYHEVNGAAGLLYGTTRGTYGAGDAFHVTLTTYLAVSGNGATLEPKAFVDGPGAAVTEILANATELTVKVI